MMRLKLLFVFFLSLFLLKISFSTERNVENEMALSLSKLMRCFSENKNDSVLILSKELMQTSSSISDPKYLAPANYYYGSYLAIEGNIDSSNYYFEKAIVNYRLIHDTVSIGEKSIRLAHQLKLQGKTNAAIKNYLVGINILKDTDSKFWYALGNDHLGFMYSKIGDNYNALKHFKIAVASFEELGQLMNVGNLTNKIGLVYRNTEDIEKEKESYLKAIEILEQLDISKNLGMVYNNLSEVYFELGEEKNGFEALEKAKIIYEKTNYPLGLCGYYSVLAYHYSHSTPPNHRKVIEYGEMGNLIALEYDDLRQFSSVSHILGESYMLLGQFEKAEETLKNGYRIAHKYDYKTELLTLTITLTNLYKELNKSSIALKYLEEYLVLSDSLKNEEKIKEFTQLDMSFKFKEERIKDSLNQLRINQELEFEHDQEIQYQKQSKIVIVFILIVVALLALFIFVYARRKRNQKIVLQEKNSIINNSLEEKELLLKEIHHRVKNSLQLVSSLLQLQSKEIQDETALKSIHEGQERVKAMALIHQKLYQNKDLTTIDFHEYCSLLANEIRSIYSQQETVNIKLEIDNMHFDIDTAIPLGLILNELITNSFKYAFSESKENSLFISITKHEEGNYLLLVKDNGKGLPEDLDLKKVKSLGLRLVKRLSKQLHGSFECLNDNGSVFKVQFKNTEHRRLAE